MPVDRILYLALLLIGMTNVSAAHASETAPQHREGDPQRGYRLLTKKAYLPPDFDQTVFDEIWKTWEEPLRSQAERATKAERRQMAFSRYGLTQDPDAPDGYPLQYVVDRKGNWSMNCLACHQGKVAGQVIPGVPNTLYALETLTQEVRATKLRMERPLSRMDVGSLVMPLGTTNGTTNAVMFGVALMSFRDPQLNVLDHNTVPQMVHHDHDAPAWWNFAKRRTLYSDGFAPKSHRALMQFLLVRQNGPEKFREWEDEFRDIYAYIQSLEPPKYPYSINEPLATAGRAVFNANCASCHGTYSDRDDYPNKVVPIDEIGTDRVRLDSLTREHRSLYANSWFNELASTDTSLDPGGYVAPPLDGVWASAPYFHNGSVPTLWHVLHPDERPKVWIRSEDGYDHSRVGLEVQSLESVPFLVKLSAKERRKYFDTTRPGKAAHGHDFPNALTANEKQAVLEYLKTL